MRSTEPGCVPGGTVTCIARPSGACTCITAPGYPLGGTRTLVGEFWQKPEHPSTQNTLSNRVQAKFDKWNRSGKQYWAEEALRVGRRDAMLTSNEITATEAAAKKETELLAAKTFKLTEAPNRICWSMCVHAGDNKDTSE